MFAALVLCLSILINPTLAGPRPYPLLTARNSAFLPSCASSCLEEFISSSFPTSICSDQTNIVCLCTSNSLSGFTFGEGALQCIVASCPDATASEYQSAYAVCSGIPNAAPETHGTISASMASPSTILLGPHSTPTSSIRRTATPTSRLTSTTSSVPNLLTDSTSPSRETTSLSVKFSGMLTPSGSPAFSMNLATATGSVAAAGASSSATPAARQALNSSQIIGISVAGGALLLIGVGVVFFIFWSKRRKENKRDSGSSFGGDEILGASPNIAEKHFGYQSPPPLSAGPRYVSPKAQQILGTDTNRFSLWQRPPKPQDIGLAVTPRPEQGFVHDVSPISVASYQTTSRLLPDKPTASRGPSPTWRPSPIGVASYQPTQEKPSPAWRPSPIGVVGYQPKFKRLPENSFQHARRAAPLQQAGQIPRKPVRFAEGVGLRIVAPTPPPSDPVRSQASKSPKSSPDSSQSGPIITRQPSDPFLRPPENARSRQNQKSQNLLRRASRFDLPRLKTYGFDKSTSTGDCQNMPSVLSHPQPTYNPADYALVDAPASQPPIWKPSTQPTSQYSQTRPSANYSTVPAQTSYTPYHPAAFQQPELIFNKYAPLQPTNSESRRPLTHLTTGSETSFEDDGDADDSRASAAWPISAAANPVLSPVVESPARAQKQSLSQIRYPAIPRKPSSKKTLRVSPGKARPSPTVSPPSAGPSPPTPQSLKRKPNFVLPAWQTLTPPNPMYYFQDESDCDTGPYELSAGSDCRQKPAHLQQQRQRGQQLLQQQRQSPISGSPGANNDAIRGTAKWAVLCSPGGSRGGSGGGTSAGFSPRGAVSQPTPPRSSPRERRYNRAVAG